MIGPDKSVDIDFSDEPTKPTIKNTWDMPDPDINPDVELRGDLEMVFAWAEKYAGKRVGGANLVARIHNVKRRLYNRLRGGNAIS